MLVQCIVTIAQFFRFLSLFLSELEALGDDVLLDDDSSFLDAVNAPDPPAAVPGGPESVRAKDGVALDEFGLPQLQN